MTTLERTLEAIAEDHPEISIDHASFARLGDSPAANTKISYMYRDALNYKAHGYTTFAGVITPSELDTILNHLDEDGGFIPGQVGMADLQPTMVGGWKEDDDHPFHDLTEIELTTELADNVSTKELARYFSEVSWDQEYRPS